MVEIAIQTATTEVSLKNQALAQLMPIEANIANMKAQYGSKVYDCTTTAGMAEAKADRVAIREVRYKIPHIEKDVTRQLNDLKKDIQTKAAKLTDELIAIERVSDDQIKAEEERKAVIAAEKARLAAEAQKILDDKIIEIAKLPVKCISQPSDDITTFLAALEAHPIGGEFTGETLVRAETAKSEAVAEIRTMLAKTIEAEETAARIKAEQEAAAVKAESERIEREKQEAIQREELARQQAELAEQKRLQDIEIAKQQAELKELQRKQAEAQKIIDEANAAEQKRLDAIRLADEQKVAEERAKIEAERQATQAKARAEQAEKDRIQREEEQERLKQAAIKAKEEEEARLAAEKAKALAEAKCETASVAFRKIIDLCNNHDLNETELRAKVSIIAEGNL